MSLAPGLALIFDMDGVIVDSMPVHTEAWRVYLHQLGIECSDIEARMHGRRNDDIVIDFIGAHLCAEEIRAHGAAKEALYREMIHADLRARLVPGVEGFLERFSRAPLAVATNAEKANVDFILDGARLRRYFSVIIDGAQVAKPKPFPDVYVRAAERLGIDSKNCIVFEDSPAGVEAARAAGARVVGVETHRPLEGVDLRAKDFLDLELERWLSRQQTQ
jgi:beta-phosphoglucomutase family hydrolase